MPIDHTEGYVPGATDDLPVTEQTILNISENMEYVADQLSKTLDNDGINKLGVQAQVAQAQALAIIAGETLRLVNAVNGATTALQRLTKAVKDTKDADPKLLNALGDIRKVISANG